jgi:tRNA dimethylallyltransferase
VTGNSARLPRAPLPNEPDGAANRSACLVICGPTAAGKTRLALALNDALDVVAVSADSRQVYRGFDIGTAKPTAAERAALPHACRDLTTPAVRFSAYAWAAEAERALEEASGAGRAPLVVGGAGFYVRALVHPVTPDAPQGAERITAYYLLVDPGAPLRDRIARRAATMMNEGWPEEVASLLGRVPSEAVAWNACGYGAIRAYVEGRLSRDAALERVTIATRQYAKRQRTWFRHQLPVDRVTRINPDDPEAVRHALTWVRRHSRSPVGVR